MNRTRQIILLVVVAFVVFAVYTRPDRSADAVAAIGRGVAAAASAAGRFADQLLKRWGGS